MPHYKAKRKARRKAKPTIREIDLAYLLYVRSNKLPTKAWFGKQLKRLHNDSYEDCYSVAGDEFKPRVIS